MNTQYGVYADNLITYGTFEKGEDSPLDNDEVLLKVMDTDINGETGLLDTTIFKFEGNDIYFSKEVSEEKDDSDLDHAIEETKLDVLVDESLTESLFYGVGLQAV